MQISTEYPPNFALIKNTFPNVDAFKALFCYSSTIFNPYSIDLTEDLIIHEEAHSKRQGNNPDEWWGEYLSDISFRKEEEIIAYGEQFAWITKLPMKYAVKQWKLEKMAQALSGGLYGLEMSYGEAESKIRNYDNTH